MRCAMNTCIVGRKDNVLVVDFTRGPEPPAPRFQGANALRGENTEEVALRLASPRRAVTA